MKVKVCGLTSLEEAQWAVDGGAWALGFVFHPSSPRSVSPSDVASWIKKLPRSVRKVGVVVNQSSETLKKLYEVTGLDTLQLHGEESEALLDQICSWLPREGRLWKAYRPRSLSDLSTAAVMAQRPQVEAFLLDAYRPEAHGGTGHLADLTFAEELKTKKNLILAGGLRPSNVVSLVQEVQPWAVDVSSGVEREPGRKDPEKLKAFFEALKGTK